MRALKVNSNSKNGGNQKQFLNLKRSKPKRGHYSYLNKERGGNTNNEFDVEL